MRLLFAGTPTVAVPTLRALVDAGHDVVAAITRPDAPLGRKRVLTPSPVAQAAAQLGVPVWKAKRFDAELRERVRAVGADAGVVVAYGAIIPDDVLSAPAAGWINLHFSLLPRWRGAAPVQRALLAGDAAIGFSVIRVMHDLDAGDVLARRRVPGAELLTADAALDLIADEGAPSVVAVLRAIEQGTAVGVPQGDAGEYAAKLTRADARIDWAQPAARVLAVYRAATSEPGAWCEYQGSPFKVLGLSPAAGNADAASGATGAELDQPLEPIAPGSLRLVRGAVYARAADAWLRLERVQPAGKAAMAARDWANGADLGAGLA